MREASKRPIQPVMVNTVTQETLDSLRAYECQNITRIAPDGSWPIVWERARGVHVWDAAGRRYLDLTAAFGVAAAGHANSRVVRAGQRQMAQLLHAMGDVHPHALKGRLVQELSRLTFEKWTRGTRNPVYGKTILCNSGFEAVEAALKTALLATGRRGVIAFRGGYHGLGYGALSVNSRKFFRAPFRSQLGRFGHFVPFPTHQISLNELGPLLERTLHNNAIGAILVEPIQGRGGIRIPPLGLLPLLRRLSTDYGCLLIVDEILTGFGRTGEWFASEHSGTVPDLVCLGKALTGGFPLSACVGAADLMDAAWPKSTGEAIHTSTFLGHPVGCAMALAQIEEITDKGLVEQSAVRGQILLQLLSQVVAPPGFQISARGLGLLAGLEITSLGGKPAPIPTLRAIEGMLRRGFILLPEGEDSNVISFSPPLVVSDSQIRQAVHALKQVFEEQEFQT